jgi:hypothetical protein
VVVFRNPLFIDDASDSLWTMIGEKDVPSIVVGLPDD